MILSVDDSDTLQL